VQLVLLKHARVCSCELSVLDNEAKVVLVLLQNRFC